MDVLVKEPKIKSIFWRVSLNPKPLSQEVLSWRLIGNVVPAFYSAMWLLHLSKDLASSFLLAREMTAERLFLVVEPSKMRFLSYMYIYRFYHTQKEDRILLYIGYHSITT